MVVKTTTIRACPYPQIEPAIKRHSILHYLLTYAMVTAHYKTNPTSRRKCLSYNTWALSRALAAECPLSAIGITNYRNIPLLRDLLHYQFVRTQCHGLTAHQLRLYAQRLLGCMRVIPLLDEPASLPSVRLHRDCMAKGLAAAGRCSMACWLAEELSKRVI